MLARFVNARNEAHYIARAEGSSVRRLEKELRTVDRGCLEAEGVEVDEEGAALEESTVVDVTAPLGLAFKWHRVCTEATKVAGETTPPGTVLEWVTAETLSGLSGLSRLSDLPNSEGPDASGVEELSGFLEIREEAGDPSAEAEDVP